MVLFQMVVKHDLDYDIQYVCLSMVLFQMVVKQFAYK